MKKTVLQTLFLILLSISTNATTISKALLDHNGKVTLFDGYDMQAAVDAAVDGDILYLSMGTFSGFTINKNISVRGTGEDCTIDWVSISIPNTPNLKVPVIETISVSGSVTIDSNVNNLVLRKCKISSLKFNAIVTDGIIDRCYISKDLLLSSNANGMTFINSILCGIHTVALYPCKGVFYTNCEFRLFDTRYFSGTIVNSFLCTFSIDSTINYTISSSILKNCLIHDRFIVDDSSVRNGCFKTSNKSFSDQISSFESEGYFGDDGTIVGIYGGKTPYTLEPSVPHVTNSSISLDEDKKRLNVKLTMSPQ